MRFLKQSTSVDVPVGPFLSSTDGFTAMGALTITQPDVLLKKGAGNWAQKAAAQTLTAESNGFYEVTLDATDTATLGLLRLSIQETGALPVWEDFMVMPANVWDSFFGADVLQADLLQIGGVAQSATDLKDFADDGYDPSTNKLTGLLLADTVTTLTNLPAITSNWLTAAGVAVDAVTKLRSLVTGTADSGTTTTMVDAARTEADTDYWKGCWILFTSGTIANQVRRVTAFTPGTDTFTFSPATTQAVGTNTYELLPVNFDVATLQEVIDASASGGGLLISTTILALSSQTVFTLAAGSADNDAYNGALCIITDATTATQKAQGVVLDYVGGGTRQITLKDNPAIFTMAASDLVTILADRSLKPTVDLRTLDVSTGGEAGLDWANVGTQTATVGLTNTTVGIVTLLNSLAANVITATAIATGALTAAKFAAGAFAAVWDTLESAIVTASTIGLKIKTNLDAAITSRSTVTTGQVKTEVVNALNVDTYAEPVQGNPPATTTIVAKLGYQYKAWRNRAQQTSSTYSLYADDGTTVDQKATVSDDGTTTTIGEVVTGP